MNAYTENRGVETPVFRVDPTLEKEQTEALAKRKQTRDGERVADALSRVDAAARGTDNLMPHIVHAVSMRVSIGEICATLANVFGKHREGGRA
jgi:methylmalonyl-CoA mutase N-terminal domain/subunit